MDKSAIFNDSFEKCLQGHYGAFFEIFYREFEASSPKIKTLFANTDPQRRYDMLEESILILATYSVDHKVTPELKQLALLHARLGLDTTMFDCWFDALMATLSSVDSRFDEDHIEAWREVLSPGILYLKQSCPSS